MPEAPYFDALDCRIYKSQVYRESIHGPGHTQVDRKFAIFLGVQIAKNGTQPETSRTADPQREAAGALRPGGDRSGPATAERAALFAAGARADPRVAVTNFSENGNRT
jgi:hypothetical protein